MAKTLKDAKQELIYVRDKLYDSLSTAEENGKQKGKKEERNEFWEMYQEGGNRKRYINAFSYEGWTDDSYNPIYPIHPTIKYGIQAAFYWNMRITNTKVDIIIDNGSAYNAFSNATALERIPYIEFNNCTDFSNAFLNDTKLTYIRVGGEIDKSIDFSSCPLDAESAVSVIEHLADLSSNKGSATIAFSKHTADLLDENNTQIIPPNVPTYMYNWRDYITDFIYWGLSI